MEGKQLAGRYHIVRYIGGGGMAAVYLAQDMVLDRYVAIKVLYEEYSKDWEFVQRFVREAKTAGKLSHPNIVNVFDAGVDNHIYYIVMEFVDGASLNHIIQQKGQLSALETISIAIQICQGLGHAHDHGIIHRDIKPHNILFTQNGQAKVSDFGISRFVQSNTALTQTGIVVGTVPYFSPEQAKGAKLSFTSDLYSLGIVLYEMVTGQLPFTGNDSVSIALKHIQEPLPDPRQLNPHITDKLYFIIRKATEKDPAHRYQSAYEMAYDLQQALMELQHYQPTPVNSVGSSSSSLLQQAGQHAPKLIQDFIQHKSKDLIYKILGMLIKYIRK
ncbi:protein kinase domain-containing protein [Thermoflavimicrobium dichotomicum]|uniref:Serine/threonine-protein kinase PrkC n=1 Tax=Thermoflavimicrobium dichotomicum TaxID=46223 RepID=A0A1I3NX30_9BACL|nr:protein kinase [Thermoflavimicrobium dichotomicum]SFJ13662.1 serine/threonine protein kinase [Thermoflavimicrobium dichotomicum]